MTAINLTEKEEEVLRLMIEISDGEEGFILEDIDMPLPQLKGYTSSLQKKGLISMNNGESYYDGFVTKEGLRAI